MVLLLGLALPALGSCTSCGDVDGPGVDNMLATAERWLHVLTWDDVGTSDGTDPFELEVASVAPERSEGRPRVEPVWIHGSFLPGIEEAIEGGDAVYLAMASESLVREVVPYVLAVTPEGDHRLPGECVAEGEALVRDRLGGRYDDVMAQVIGNTDRDRILLVLEARA
jgi:hypothetical protein